MPNRTIKIFISHSSSDSEFVGLITELLTNALEISENEIRCTSIPGFRLQAGSHTSVQLKTEIQNCMVVMGILTRSSMESLYVMFELGAAWGLERRIIPVCGPGFEFRDLRPPLNEVHAIKWSSQQDWLQLIENISQTLEVRTRSISRISSYVEKILSYSYPQ